MRSTSEGGEGLLERDGLVGDLGNKVKKLSYLLKTGNCKQLLSL